MPSKCRGPAKPKAVESRLSRGRTQAGAIFPVPPTGVSLPAGHAATLQEIQAHLRSARVRAVLSVNPIVIDAYWQTGKIILARQKEAAWGAKVIDRLAADLQQAFPDMRALTRRNLFLMRAFAEAFPEGPIVKQPVSQLPWGQIIRVIQMVKSPADRDFYIRECLAHGWSRSTLEAQIQSGLHRRAGKALNNFSRTMPPTVSDMAAQAFKDPYLFVLRTTNRPLGCYSAGERTSWWLSVPSAGWTSLSPWPTGRRKSPRPCPPNSRAACQPSKKSRPNWQ